MNILANIIRYCTIVLLATAFFACSDDEGEGGKATISGKLYYISDNGAIEAKGTFPDLQCKFVRDTTPALGEDVYIIYGNSGEVYDDKTKTSYKGKYQFKYLRAGDYKIYAIGDNCTYEMTKVSVGKKEDAKAKSLYLKDGKNTGKCGIVGKIMVKHPSKNTTDAGVGARVYLQKEGQVTVEDTRGDCDGLFTFPKLEPKTTYKVWAEFEMVKNGAVTSGTPIVVSTGKGGEITILKEAILSQSY